MGSLVWRNENVCAVVVVRWRRRGHGAAPKCVFYYLVSDLSLQGTEEELQQLTERLEKTAVGYDKSKIIVNSTNPRPSTNIIENAWHVIQRT